MYKLQHARSEQLITMSQVADVCHQVYIDFAQQHTSYVPCIYVRTGPHFNYIDTSQVTLGLLHGLEYCSCMETWLA